MRISKFFPLFIMLAAIMLPGVKQSYGQGYYFYNNGYYESNLVLEAGINGGLINGMTDVGGSKKGKANSGFAGDFTLNESHFMGGLYGVATWKDWLGVRLELNLGKLEAADSNLKGTNSKWAEGRYVRNLSFRTTIFEVATGLEVHPLMLRTYIEKPPPRLSPYIIAGFSWIKFNPKAKLNGTWYELEPLRLEGQGFSEYPDRKRYRRNSFEVPYGIGVRYEASEWLNIRIEGLKHTTFTDYLDDVSQGDWVDPSLFYKYLSASNAAIATQLYNRSTVINPPRNTRPRGNPKDNDAFWNFTIKLGINLNRVRVGSTRGAGFRGKAGKVSCPSTVL